MSESLIVVGIMNSSDDTVEMLRVYLEEEGFLVVSAHVHAIRRGEQTVSDAIGEHRPKVIVYDVSPPYDRSWMFLEHLQTMDVLKDCRWVITTTNVAQVKKLSPAAASTDVYEIIGKPYDLREIVAAVKREAAK